MASAPTIAERKQPFEVWLAGELARRYPDQGPIPEQMCRLCEKLGETDAEIGCATAEVSAKTAE